MKKRKKRLFLVPFVLSLLLSVTACTNNTEKAPEISAGNTTSDHTSIEDTDFSITYIDVGQADAALIECEGHSMLIDGGNRDDSDRLYTILEDRGISYLDLVIATHAHEDHIGGIPGALTYASAGTILTPVTDYDSAIFSTFMDSAQKSGAEIVIPAAGDVYSLGSAQVTILGLNASDDTNNTSIISKVSYGDTSFLFTGDAERPAEETVIDSGADLSADVLKVGHHGSDSSTSYPFLREVMPKYAVISAGKDNKYGHPDQTTLSRLEDAGVKIYRTDLNGDIQVLSDGKTVFVSADKKTAEESAGSQEKNYVVNTSTGKFHLPSCGSVKKISADNRMDIRSTRKDLIKKGYEPCGSCQP